MKEMEEDIISKGKRWEDIDKIMTDHEGICADHKITKEEERHQTLLTNHMRN